MPEPAAPTVAFLSVMNAVRRARVEKVAPPGWRIASLASTAAEDQAALFADTDYLVTGGAHPVTAALLRGAPRLKLVHKWGVGVDDIDLAEARARGVKVARTTGSNAIPVAEFAIGLMLALGRAIPRGDAGMRQGKWLKGELAPQTFMLSGKTVGIVGLGNIGRALAQRLSGFGVTILAHSRSPQPEQEARLNVSRVPMEELLARADILALCCPLTEETRNLIDAGALGLMKPTAVLINVARGGVVDEDALAAALAAGTIAGAALDVFATEPPPDHPLLHMDNVIVTPHLAGACGDNAPKELARIFDNILRVSRNEPIPTQDMVV